MTNTFVSFPEDSVFVLWLNFAGLCLYQIRPNNLFLSSYNQRSSFRFRFPSVRNNLRSLLLTSVNCCRNWPCNSFHFQFFDLTSFLTFLSSSILETCWLCFAADKILFVLLIFRHLIKGIGLTTQKQQCSQSHRNTIRLQYIEIWLAV